MRREILAGILVAIIILMPSIVSADGGFFIPFGYENIYQPSQKAVIIYDEGKEDLILQVKYEKGAENFMGGSSARLSSGL